MDRPEISKIWVKTDIDYTTNSTRALYNWLFSYAGDNTSKRRISKDTNRVTLAVL